MEQNTDFKKSKAPATTVTRDLNMLEAKTGNIYEAVIICSKRANQISVEIKEELSRKLEEFANYTDKLKYQSFTKGCRSIHLLPWRNSKTIRYTCARLSNFVYLSC
jgi:hypothetical protein